MDGRVERRAPYPIVNLALLRDRVLASALGSMTLAMLALFGIGFILPFYFEELRGFSVMESGLLLTHSKPSRGRVPQKDGGEDSREHTDREEER